MNKKLDNYNEHFPTFGDFIKCVEDREANTERLTVPAKSVKFLPIFPDEVDKVAKSLGVDRDLVDDTIRRDRGTCLILQTGLSSYLVGSSSYMSISQRVKLFGEGLYKLDNEIKAEAFEDLFSQIRNDVKIVVIDDKVRAVMSNEYAYVPMQDIFKEFVKGVAEKFDDKFIVEEAYVDHTVATLKILFDKGTDQLTDLYKLPQADNWMPGLVITTSDTGYHSVKVGPYFKGPKGACVVPAAEYIGQKHIGDVTLKDLLDELPNIFLKYQDSVEKMIKLLEVEIKNPVTVIKKAAEHMKFTKKAIEGMAEKMQYFAVINPNQVTAYDVYSILSTYPEYVEGTPQTKLLAQEMAGKAINQNYSKWDV